jgi:hypothetical protein
MANNDEEKKMPVVGADGEPIEGEEYVEESEMWWKKQGTNPNKSEPEPETQEGALQSTEAGASIPEPEMSLVAGDPGKTAKEGYFGELETSAEVEKALDLWSQAAGERADYYASPEFAGDLEKEQLRGMSRALGKLDVRDPFALIQGSEDARQKAAQLALAGKDRGLKAKMEAGEIEADVAREKREDLARTSEMKEETLDQFHGQINNIIKNNTTWVWADDVNIAAQIRKAAEALPFDDEKKKWLNIARRIENNELDVDSDMTWESITTDTTGGTFLSKLPDPFDLF